ncbi:MAG TPA: FAD:protein FMN transferase [Armatimonadota bacterium]|nr:FAD:protein FMN transferase [Armatimonadota bacterium]HQK96329.1 FAD:protein FMN transferase [Armatimonadota bacterium]
MLPDAVETEFTSQAEGAGETRPFRVRLRRPAMATQFELILDGDRDPKTLGSMAEEAYALVQQLEQQLSAYLPASELCWINESAHAGPVPVEPGLFRLLLQARNIWEETSGAFDITVGPLVKSWGFFRRQGRMPAEGDLARAMESTGMDHVALDEQKRTVRFLCPGVELNLGAIGKGFAIDEVMARLRSWGVTCALAQLGGSTVAVMGEPPVSQGWLLGVRPGGQRSPRVGAVRLHNQAISTSGDFEQYFEVDGRRFGHIIDPRTGRPAEGRLSACSISASATRSDALSTAFVVMGSERAEAFCRSRGEAAVLMEPGADGALAARAIACTLLPASDDTADRSGQNAPG